MNSFRPNARLPRYSSVQLHFFRVYYVSRGVTHRVLKFFPFLYVERPGFIIFSSASWQANPNAPWKTVPLPHFPSVEKHISRVKRISRAKIFVDFQKEENLVCIVPFFSAAIDGTMLLRRIADFKYSTTPETNHVELCTISLLGKRFSGSRLFNDTIDKTTFLQRESTLCQISLIVLKSNYIEYDRRLVKKLANNSLFDISHFGRIIPDAS